MRVVVENLTGTLFFVQLDCNATVAELRRAIGDQENLPSHRLILILDANVHRLMDISENLGEGDGDEEIDRISLLDHGVRDGSHIYIFFNPLDDGVFSLPDSSAW